jgi:predicted nuclease of predicted toxin-antitoxin system
LRLLIDEMYPPSIADQVRRCGHDAVAVAARPELRTLADPAIFTVAQEERRAVVTENVADFIRIADAYDQRGQAHHGLVLLAASQYPRGNARTIGRVVARLDALLAEHQGEDAMGLRHWL